MNVVKPDYIADLGPIDISILKSAVEKISPKLWQTEDASKENNFQCFHHTKHIIFRFIPGTHNPQQAYSNPIWLPWQGILLPILNKVAKHYNYHKVDFPKVMFAKLQSGFSIDRHIDRQSSNVLTHKIHVPIATNKDTVFIVNGKSFHLKEGHAYEVNNIVYHAVENRGETDRIHLIFEVYDISNKECLNEHS